jgi:hypothetical protein
MLMTTNFAEVFCSLLHKRRDQTAYLADDAVLDWFGHRISRKDSIAWFMKLRVPETVPFSVGRRG